MPRQVASGRVLVSGRRQIRDMKSSLSFDGANDNIVYNSEATLRTTGDVTLQAHVKHKVLGATQSYIMLNWPAEFEYSNILYSIGVTSDGKLRWLHEYGEGTNSLTLTTRSAVTTGRWINIIAVRNTTEKKIYFYVDGSLFESISYVNDATGGSASTLALGETTDGFDDFSGYMAEARIWSRALSSDEVASIHLTGDIPQTGLMLDPNFDQGVGATISDRSSSSFLGTINGAVFSGDVPMKQRQPVSGNLIYNGDFEYAPPFVAATNINGRWIDGTATGSTSSSWFGWGCPTGASASAGSWQFDSTEKYSGQNSMKIQTTNTTGSAFIANYEGAVSAAQNAIPVQPNTSYTLTAMVKTTNVPTNGAYIRLRTLSGIKAIVSNNLSNRLSGTNDWTQCTVTYMTESSARFIVPSLHLEAGQAATVWFDNVDLRPTSEITRASL